MKRLHLHAIALLAMAVPLPAFASGNFAFEKVMVVGDVAPGTEFGTSYAPFPFEYVPMVPTIDQQGHVGFSSRLQGPAINATNAVGSWTGVPGSVGLAARAGNAAPGVPSGTYRSFPEDFDLFAPLVGNGLVGVRATLSGSGINFANDNGIWIGPQGALSLIGREGSPAPGLPAGITIAEPFFLTKMNSEGRSMVSGSVNGAGVTTANDEVFWSDRTGSWTPILREGDQAPGLASGVVFGGAGQYIGTGYSFESQAFNNDGDFAAQANLTGPGITTFNNEALWVEHDGLLKLLAREGAHAPGMPPNVVFGSGVLADFGDITFNALEQAAFTARLGDGSATYALFTDHTGALGPIALPGTPAPGTTEDFGIVGYQALSDAGRIAFRATLSNGGQWPPLGVWWDQPGEVGELMALVVPGMQLPSDPSITIISVGWIQGFNSAGWLAMRVSLFVGQDFHEAMLLGSPQGDLSILVTAGDSFDVYGDGSTYKEVSDFHFGGLNDAGQFVLRLNFTDGTHGVYRGSVNSATGVLAEGQAASLQLAQNAPNPFAQSTVLSFSLERPAPVDLAIYDAAGRRVATLVNEPLSAGIHTAHWDGQDGSGAETASGVYWARLRAAGESRTVRMVHLRP